MKWPGELGLLYQPLSRKQPELLDQARRFARVLSDLLNKTVTHGIRLSALLDARGRVIVGKGVSRTNVRGEAVPLTLSKSPARLSLYVLHTLVLDISGKLLTSYKSAYALQFAKSEKTILTYDYVSKPENDYPKAHLHLHGKSQAFRSVLDKCGHKHRMPVDLHIPVGGRFFRPCLEDIVEFCILENW